MISNYIYILLIWCMLNTWRICLRVQQLIGCGIPCLTVAAESPRSHRYFWILIFGGKHLANYVFNQSTGVPSTLILHWFEDNLSFWVYNHIHPHPQIAILNSWKAPWYHWTNMMLLRCVPPLPPIQSCRGVGWTHHLKTAWLLLVFWPQTCQAMSSLWSALCGAGSWPIEEHIQSQEMFGFDRGCGKEIRGIQNNSGKYRTWVCVL